MDNIHKTLDCTLSDATTEQLVDEIAKRCPQVFVYSSVLDKVGSDKGVCWTSHGMSGADLLGAIDYMQTYIRAQIMHEAFSSND